MDKLVYRCPNARIDIAVDVGIDALSLRRLRDQVIGIQCRCGETHFPRVNELYPEPPHHNLSLRLRSDVSGING
jgi:hypothetical protein